MPRARFLGMAALLALPFGVASSRGSVTPPIVFSADRAPTVTGEIYRLDPSGHRIDLSRSPYQDIDPVVSSDGKRVAFISDRRGAYRIYEVGIGGRGLVAVTPPLPGLGPGATKLAWQPHGHRLAVETTPASVPNGRTWIIPAPGKRIHVSNFGFGRWSPDGRILLVWAGDEIRAVTPQGHKLWTAAADQPAGAWSPQGLLAVAAYRRVLVYDERGHRVASFRMVTTNPTLAWSPDGQRLAVLSGGATYTLEVRTADGKLLLEKNVPGGGMAWAGPSTVVFGYTGCLTCKTTGVDVRTGKLSPASTGWLDPLSPDRRLAIVTPSSASGFSLGVAAPGGGPETAYAGIGGCSGDGNWMPAVSSLQFAGRSRSLVYQSWNDCEAPFANLYSVTPTGGMRRLTNVQAQETQPAASPSGDEIAYVWAQGIGSNCKGCSDGIRLASSDGTALRTLTDPPDCTFDDSPTWSPDGVTILYSESSCDSAAPHLYTIPASGGPPHDLHIAGSEPAWGPSRIAYSRNGGLWTAKPDGSDRAKVARGGTQPAWSRDGRLAYILGTSGTTVVVGSKHERLPFRSVKSLAWSPDGTRFVVTAQTTKSGPFDLYAVRTDGTHPVRVTKNYDALGASWR